MANVDKSQTGEKITGIRPVRPRAEMHGCVAAPPARRRRLRAGQNRKSDRSEDAALAFHNFPKQNPTLPRGEQRQHDGGHCRPPLHRKQRCGRITHGLREEARRGNIPTLLTSEEWDVRQDECEVPCC